MAVPLLDPLIEYPETDGLPMPDGEYQSEAWRHLVGILKFHYRARDVYAAGNLFIYLEEGNAGNRVAPDLFVVLGASDHRRDTYKVWEEPGGMPDFVLEILSPSTWRKDLGPKMQRYASLGVGEYWLHDPHARFLRPGLAGRRLVDGAYVELPPVETPRGRSIRSDVLGLDLFLDGEELRFFDPVEQRALPSLEEISAEYHRQRGELDAAHARIAELERALRERGS